MARFDDLYERFRKKRKEKGTGYSGAGDFTSGDATDFSTYTGTGRFAGILEKARKNGVSFSGVDENYIQSFMQDAQSFVKKSQQESQSLTWAGATSQEQYDNRVKTMQDLGTRADAVRVYLNANKGKINPEWYDYLSGFLRDFDSDTQSIFETFHGAKGYYSRWDSQEAYDFYDAHSTPEKRQEWYTGLDTKKKELEAEKEKEAAAWQQMLQNGFKSRDDYEKQKRSYEEKIKNIQAKIDEVDTERRQYERGAYGSKTKDEIYFLSKNADYATLSQRRDLGNATKADYDKWYYEAEGGYILEDETMQTLYHKEEGSIPEKDKSTFQINDPLGFYLQAVDADKRNEQIYVSHNGGAREYDWVMEKGESGKWELLDEDETNAYYYKLNKEGEEAALAFLDSLKPELEKRKAENVAKTTEEFYKNADLIGKIILNTATVPANLVGGTIGLANNAKNLIQGKEIDPYSGANALNRFSNNIRGTTAQELDELMPGVKLPGIDFTVGDLYQTVMSRVDSLAAMGIGGKLGGVLLATGAAENEMTRLYEQGASLKQMLWGAAAVGAAELVFESLSIEKLQKIKDAKIGLGRVKTALLQGGIEASEEGFTEIANILSNAAIMGSQSDWNKLVADNNGDKKAAFLEKVRDVAKAGFGGFLSGAMGGAAMTRDGKTQEDIKEDIDRMTPMDAEWTLETQPETRVEEVGLPLQDSKQAEAELKKQRFAVDLPMPEDIARMEAGERAQGAQEPGQEAQAPEEIGFPTREDVAQMEAREEPRSRVEEVGLPMPESREDQDAQSKERTRRAEEILGDKGSYMSKNAAELYEELSGLKKGVKASSRLGYILDHGYEWRSVKTALLNIRDNPSEVVNPNSQAEALIREVLGREYDDTVEDLSRPDEVTNQYAEKLWNIKTEIANNQRLREENMADYQEEIDRLQEMYDGKANKTTKAANDILRRIERVTRMKNTVDGDYTRRIERLQERVDKMDTDVYRRAQQRRSKQAQYEREVAELIGDTSTWKDKKLGVSYWINTLRRNLRDVVRDENGKRDIEKAYAIYDYLQGQYNHDEAGRKRETAKIKNPYAELEITKEEDAYIQMLGELRHNPSTELSLEVVEEYYEKHKKHIDKAKVDKAIEMSRKTYDELFARLNKRLREQGMKEIPYRKGYFPHFTEDAQGPIAKFLNWKTKNNEIPTDIAGLTEGFNPERSWQSFNKERTGDTTTYSFLRGMDTYVQGALDWIYHIEDIQRRRALENYIRYVHSDEGIRARIDEIKANEEYDADEAQQMIDAVLAEAKNPLGNFVQDLRTGTNILAGKKNTLDRGVESATNRKIYSVMTNLSNRVSANQVAGSISSAMTNFIPITQSWGQVSPVSSLRAMLDTIRNAVSDDGTVNKSDFLTNRLRNPDNLYKGTWDKISDKVGWLMEAVDSFSSQTVWRSKYMENIAAGMSEAEAIRDADQFAENVLAGRSRGNMPTAFNAKNPIAKVATAFQLEVANQYGYILKDMPQDMKKETTGKLVKGYATMFLGAYLYNMAFSALTGRDSALDPIGIIEQLIRGLTDEEEEPKDAVTDFLENVLQEVPFVGGLMGGGRVPLSSALPYDGVWGMVEGLTQDIGSGDWKSVWEELSNPLYYLVSPMGGGQIRKTAQGLGMYFNEVPGSYTYDENGEPQLRYPVEEGIAPWLQAALFGKWSGQNAQQYLEEGRKPLSAKQTREFFESGMTIQEYWDYRDEMTKLKKQDEKLALINGMDITEDQKRVLKSYLFDEEKYAEENPEKYAFLEEEGIGYLGWKELPDDAQQAWEWAFENPDKAVMVDVFADGVVEYRKYIKAMSEMKSDKDADGKTVAGSRKQKVTDYINSLDIDYGEKIILYVTEFNSTASRDMYGNEIVEYLNGRNDLSEKQIREILKQLGFEVAEDGRVTWE